MKIMAHTMATCEMSVRDPSWPEDHHPSSGLLDEEKQGHAGKGIQSVTYVR